MNKKEMAVSFLKAAASGEVKAAYDKFIASNFIHHNQYFKGDRTSLMVAMEEASKTHPNKSIEVKHVYEDGNTVVTHSQVLRKDTNAAPIAVVHIFRFENNKVVELWDLGQELMKDSPNENGAF
ncbi:nuclear transport factor 2 family protein [Bdellovibrio sp. HCB337]|uniref:nuclear transport factor 2 family protein n=1 Tax=Bdellovibrio sp. HCB337 TaxID=3394358 RepID=UPI0039A56802